MAGHVAPQSKGVRELQDSQLVIRTKSETPDERHVLTDRLVCVTNRVREGNPLCRGVLQLDQCARCRNLATVEATASRWR